MKFSLGPEGETKLTSQLCKAAAISATLKSNKSNTDSYLNYLMVCDARFVVGKN
jgi:hypothetical protein